MTLILASADGDILISATARATFTIPSEWLAYWFSNASIFDSPQGRNNFFEGSLDEIGITQNCGIPWWYRIGRRWSCHQTNMRSMQFESILKWRTLRFSIIMLKDKSGFLCINYKNQILPSPGGNFSGKSTILTPFSLYNSISKYWFFLAAYRRPG